MDKSLMLYHAMRIETLKVLHEKVKQLDTELIFYPSGVVRYKNSNIYYDT